jgi:ubiquinone/menaquinone biosynthesis C-methylase UbiE
VLLAAVLMEVVLFAIAAAAYFLPNGQDALLYVIPPACLIVSGYFGYWAARGAGNRFVLHGTAVGLIAAVVYIGLTWGKALPLAYVISHALKIIGSAAGGFIAQRRSANIVTSSVPIDTSMAEAYEATLVPVMLRPWAELMVREAQIAQGMRTLDVACGTGIVARCAAQICGASGRSAGVDIDPAMIEVARAASVKEGLNVDYHCAPADELPFEAATFDAAFCQQGLQYFPDKKRALTEMHRVLRPNGRLVIAVWTAMQENTGHWAMINALERRNIDASAMRKPFALSDPAGLQALVEEAGFSQVNVQIARRTARFASAKSFVEAIARGAPSSRQALAKVPRPNWADFLADVEAQLAPTAGSAQLELTTACNVLIARR